MAPDVDQTFLFFSEQPLCEPLPRQFTPIALLCTRNFLWCEFVLFSLFLFTPFSFLLPKMHWNHCLTGTKCVQSHASPAPTTHMNAAHSGILFCIDTQIHNKQAVKRFRFHSHEISRSSKKVNKWPNFNRCSDNARREQINTLLLFGHSQPFFRLRNRANGANFSLLFDSILVVFLFYNEMRAEGHTRNAMGQRFNCCNTRLTIVQLFGACSEQTQHIGQ